MIQVIVGRRPCGNMLCFNVSLNGYRPAEVNAVYYNIHEAVGPLTSDKPKPDIIKLPKVLSKLSPKKLMHKLSTHFLLSP